MITNTQKASSIPDPSDSTFIPEHFTLGLKDANNMHKLSYDFTSNKQVKTYNGEVLACDLSVIGVNKCHITYEIQVISLENKVTAI